MIEVLTNAEMSEAVDQRGAGGFVATVEDETEQAGRAGEVALP